MIIMRTEKDIISSLEIPDEALYGIHALRAKQHFPDQSPFHREWYQAVGMVKLACYLTIESYYNAVRRKYGDKPVPGRWMDKEVLTALIRAASGVSEGKYFDHFIVPAISGGAGTSINMNVNEIIANAALQKLGHKPGNYPVVDPVEHANLYQSTNDIIPTSLKLAVMRLLNALEEGINRLRFANEGNEKQHRNTLRIAYTQMQEAVPTSYGRLLSTYNEALSRDWWRVSKCFERIKVINLGGTAVGTGITTPRYFMLEVPQTLQRISGLPLTRAENLSDATNNLDSLVEVHGILKAHAVNLEKMVSDLRLLSSDLIAQKEVEIPQKQAGSSIMPGKINPVIPEFTISAVHKVYANDMLISSLCGQGCLDLNAYIPTIGHALIESLKMLIASNQSIQQHLVAGLIIRENTARQKLFYSPAITTALLPHIGYKAATELTMAMKKNGLSIFEANQQLQLVQNEKLEHILRPENLLKEGYTIKDILGDE